MDIFRKERKKEKHTPGDYKVLFSCVRVQKKRRVERLNPKRQRQNFLSPEDKTKKKKKAKEIKSTKHTHIQSGMRTKTGKKSFFFGFFKSLQKSRRYKREGVEQTHAHKNVFFFCFLYFSFLGFISRDRNYK